MGDRSWPVDEFGSSASRGNDRAGPELPHPVLQVTDSVADRLRRSRRKPSSLLVGLLFAGVLAAVVLLFGFWLANRPQLVLASIGELSIDETEPLRVPVRLDPNFRAPDRVVFSLRGAPSGASIDRGTGMITWCPTESQGPGTYEMVIRVEAEGRKDLFAEQPTRIVVHEVDQAPHVAEIAEQSVLPGQTLKLRVLAEDQDEPSGPLRFALARGAPPGARIGATDGRFQWTLQDVQPGETHEIGVMVAKSEGHPRTKRTFRVSVVEPETSRLDPEVVIDQFVEELRSDGAEVSAIVRRFPLPPLVGARRLLSIDGQRVGVFGYAGAEAAARDAQGLTDDDLEPYAKSAPEPTLAYLFHNDRLIAFYVGRDANLLNLLDKRLGRPAVVKTIEAAPPTEETPNELAEASDQDQGDEIILDLHKKNRLLSKTEYRTLRKVFADRFERKHREEIEQVLGGPEDEMRQWLDEHVDIREEFYLAIDPEHDNVPQVLALFKELKDRFPGKFEPYANLAIAVAVVWDVPKKAIHGSPRRQHKSLQPEKEVGPIENFEYFLDTEGVMQGRAQFLPWEFLVHTVNHRTPLNERHWALTTYLSKRSMFGKCYGDVPYDGGMREGLTPKLAGKPHTLPNVLRFGGVCTCRADFAARVGKSIGVPAFSVGGKSRYGEGHGWVMWVELRQVTRTGFTFSLESRGRFRGDHYYKGNLNDPHTGQRTTDRDLERRLHTVGMDPIAKRQADLVMRAYPMLRKRTEMGTTKQLLFLSRVIDFSPGNEEAWIALAQMSREGQITKTNSKPMTHVMDRLFTTFAKLPDFTWVVFDDLVSFQDNPKQRAALFGRLAGLYEQAGRPDLSCEARLKYAEYLVADERLDEAIQGLTVGILLFHKEGNFVPRMLDGLEELCQKHGDAQGHLVQFYQQFLPKIPQKRGKRPSNYCMSMYKRGIKCFQETGLEQLAQAYQAQLAALEAERGG